MLFAQIQWPRYDAMRRHTILADDMYSVTTPVGRLKLDVVDTSLGLILRSTSPPVRHVFNIKQYPPPLKSGPPGHLALHNKRLPCSLYNAYSRTSFPRVLGEGRLRVRNRLLRTLPELLYSSNYVWDAAITRIIIMP